VLTSTQQILVEQQVCVKHYYVFLCIRQHGESDNTKEIRPL